MDLASYWKQQIINTISTHTDMSTVEALRLPILLLGNKYDLVRNTDGTTSIGVCNTYRPLFEGISHIYEHT